MKKILGHLRRADQDFELISDGDRIAVGLSGGKDSLVLLKALCEYQKFGVKKFEIFAITVDCTGTYSKKEGVQGSIYKDVAKFCEDLGVEYHIEPSQIFEVIFDIRKEKSPCSLCSKMRRGQLNTAAVKLGCNKVALAHHGDDLIETFLLSMTYEGRLSTFMPKSYLDRTDITQIRPLIYTMEQDIIAVSRSFPILHNPCPVNHQTRREYMKQLVAMLDKDIPDSRARMLDAIISTERYNLFDTINRKGHN